MRTKLTTVALASAPMISVFSFVGCMLDAILRASVLVEMTPKTHLRASLELR